MKLKNAFVTQQIDDTQVMVGVGDTSFNGIVRSNETAAFIVDALKHETTEAAIVEKMAAEYDAPKARIAADVHAIVEKLMSIDALDV